MVILVAIFWISGMLNQTNIGLRWMMPTFPFIFLVIAGASRWLCRRLARPNASARGTSRKTIGAGVALVLCGWLVAGTTATYPHYLAYFNELIGERTNAYKYLIDSNLDWGQDLNWLRAWMDQSGVDHVYLDYLGGGVPAHSLGDGNFTAWHSIDGLPPEESYLAISATFYQLSEFYARDHNEVSYVRMLDREPDAQVGYSLLVYKITADDRAQFLTSEQAEARAREYLNLSDDMQASDCRRVVVNEWSRSSFLPIPKKFKRPAYAVTFAAEPKPTVYVDYLTGEVWGGYQAD
jgi:hypothetical protein